MVDVSKALSHLNDASTLCATRRDGWNAGTAPPFVTVACVPGGRCARAFKACRVRDARCAPPLHCLTCERNIRRDERSMNTAHCFYTATFVTRRCAPRVNRRLL